MKARKPGDAGKSIKAVSGERPGGGSKASEDGKGKGKEALAPSIKKEAKVEDSTGTEKTAGAPKKEEDPVKELVQEAAGLLRSLRGSALKKVQVSSLEVRNQRALLDGGGHPLPPSGQK